MPERPYEPATPLPPIERQRATVLGLAREGTALARYLARHGATVTVSDAKSEDRLAEALAEIHDLDVRLFLGGHPEAALDADVVYVSPGIPPEIPFLVEARRRGIRLSSATEIVLARTPAPIVGVTGSSGKTTTTTLIGEMLREAGVRVWVGGNIGRPLVDRLDEMASSDRLVLELSSFQLECLPESPSVAVVLNLTPDHLDRHPSFAAYRDAKLGILLHQRHTDNAVLNRDDPVTRAMKGATPASVMWFSLLGDPGGDAGFLAGDRLRVRAGADVIDVCGESEVRLRGRHNVANLLAAGLAARAVGATPAAVSSVARTFAGVPHRLEVVAEIDGRTYVNDSIATSPARSMAAIRAFNPPIVLLAGGRHKNLPLDEWAATVASRVAHLIVFGEAAELLATCVADAEFAAGVAAPVVVHRTRDLDEAMSRAATVAPPGATVLLSPACTSFDAFSDYVERGEVFTRLVRRTADRRAGSPE